MKTKFIFIVLLIIISIVSKAQSVTFTPNGVWIPSITTTARTNLSATDGQLIYDTNTKSFWYYNSTTWKELNSGVSNSFWSQTDSSIVANVSGNVGIGTSSPIEKLHLDGDNFLNTGTFGSSTNLSANGEGTRMFFYPKKAAFRAGYVNGVNWNDENIGNYSVALGKSTVAKGESSIALGANSLASGSNSFAVGNTAIADATDAVAIGETAVANGEGAFSIGNNSNASNKGSMAFGKANISSGENSLAIGNNTISNNTHATAMGFATIATGMYAMSLGHASIAGGNYSNAFGFTNTASADFSLAMGNGNFTTGQRSVAFGTSLMSNSFAEIAVGANNESYNVNSTSEWNENDRLFVVGNGPTSSSRSNALTILKSGNTGIGTSSPSEKLEVNGKIKASNIQLSNGASNGYFLKSDASGNASWSSLPTTVSAENGLSLYDSNLKLGGSLTEKTNLLANNLNFSIGGTPESESILGGNYPINGFSNVSSAYQNFTTPSSLGINANITSITIRYLNGILTDPTAKLLVYLGADTTGTLLGVTNITLSGHFSTYPLASPIPLKTDTQYTFAIKLNSSPNAAWLGYNDVSTFSEGNSSLGIDTDLGFVVWQTTYNSIFLADGTNNRVGIGTATPTEKLDVVGKTKTSDLQVTGSMTLATTSKTASYSLSASDYCVIFTGSTASQTLTLPSSASTGRVIMIINHASVAVGTSPNYTTSSSATSSSITAGNVVQLLYDGSVWRKIN